MGELLTPIHLTVVAIVAFALFGGRSLASLAKDWAKVSVGSKMEIKGLKDELTSA